MNFEPTCRTEQDKHGVVEVSELKDTILSLMTDKQKKFGEVCCSGIHQNDVCLSFSVYLQGYCAP